LCRAERSARVKAVVGMCSFACEERRRRMMSVMAEFMGMMGMIIFLGADGGFVGGALVVVLWVFLVCAAVVVGQSV
jgi:hypothetical protein